MVEETGEIKEETKDLGDKQTRLEAEELSKGDLGNREDSAEINIEEMYEQSMKQIQEGERVITSPEEGRRQQILEGRSQANADPHPSPRQREVADAALNHAHGIGPNPAREPGHSRHQRCHARRRER